MMERAQKNLVSNNFITDPQEPGKYWVMNSYGIPDQPITIGRMGNQLIVIESNGNASSLAEFKKTYKYPSFEGPLDYEPAPYGEEINLPARESDEIDDEDIKIAIREAIEEDVPITNLDNIIDYVEIELGQRFSEETIDYLLDEVIADLEKESMEEDEELEDEEEEEETSDELDSEEENFK